ncbi:TPA: hypothetical protein ACG1UU_004038 [Kluyvera ascorbata]
MNDITALALIAKIKKQTESFDTVVLKEAEAKALVEALEVSEKQRAKWTWLAKQNIAEREKDISELDAARQRVAELTEFLSHIKKCLVKNDEYAPLSHEEIDTLLGIRVDGKGEKR